MNFSFVYLSKMNRAKILMSNKTNEQTDEFLKTRNEEDALSARYRRMVFNFNAVSNSEIYIYFIDVNYFN